MVQRAIELVDGARPERVAHLGSVERDPDRRNVATAVISDVGEVESIHGLPARWIERVVVGAGHPATVATDAG